MNILLSANGCWVQRSFAYFGSAILFIVLLILQGITYILDPLLAHKVTIPILILTALSVLFQLLVAWALPLKILIRNHTMFTIGAFGIKRKIDLRKVKHMIIHKSMSLGTALDMYWNVLHINRNMTNYSLAIEYIENYVISNSGQVKQGL